MSLPPQKGPMWGLAWLRFGDTDIRRTVQVKRWTADADAVGIESEVGQERLRCWVRQGAVERVDGPDTQP